MNVTKSVDAINQRRNYPVLGFHQDSEIRYAEETLKQSENIALLVFPIGVLIGTSRQPQQVRELMFKDWNIGGIFDIGESFAPVTSIKLVLVYLTKQKPEKVHFGIFSGRMFFSLPRMDLRSGLLGELPPITDEFQEYVSSIDSLLRGIPIDGQKSTKHRFFSINYDKFDKSQFNIQYYDPELSSLEEELRNKVLLSDIADVILPKSIKQKSHTLSSQYFAYPLPSRVPVSENGTNIVLQKGDILVASIGFKKAYLVHETPPIELSPPPTFFVVRPRSDTVTPYYLFLYLQSETARKYAQRFEAGTIIRRINLLTLKNFPIALPDKITQEYSKALFEKLFLTKEENKLSEIDDFLFSKKEQPTKQIQKEFYLEGLERLRLFKVELVNRLLFDDFRELNSCIDVGAYKSSMILCGSILEAVLLDWLSEVEEKDYFQEGNKDLNDLINELEECLGESFEKAHSIRKKRNLVHPKRLLKSEERITKSTCLLVVSDLKDVLKQRGLTAK